VVALADGRVLSAGEHDLFASVEHD